MKKAILFLGLILSALTAFPQLEQLQRYEVEMKMGDDPFQVVSAGERGLMLFRDTDEYDKGGSIWEFIHVDPDLNEVFEVAHNIKEEYNYSGFAHFDDKFYLLFTNYRYKERNLVMYQVDLNNGLIVEIKIRNLIPILLTEFEVTDQAALFGGYYNYRPVVVHFDFERERAFVLPGLYNNKSELVQLNINDDGTYSVVTSEFVKKVNTVIIRNFDFRGQQISELTLTPGEGKNLTSGRTVLGDDNRMVMVGAYSNRRQTDYTRGLYLANIDNFGEYDIDYYNYGDLDNFFSYMKAGRQKRVSEKIKRRRVKGKRLRFNYRLMVHDIIKQDDTYVLLGEAYYPKYTANYSSMRIFDPVNARNTRSNYYDGGVFEGYRYTHAVVIGFDANGKLLWDNSFEINDVITFNLRQFVHATPMEDMIVLQYLFENVIRTKIIQGDEVLEGKSVEDVKLKFTHDVVQDNNFREGGLDEWYDDYLVAYGIQRIKNTRDEGVKLNRKVFFVNKIKYQ